MLVTIERLHQINLGSHQYQLIHATIFKVNLTQPSEDGNIAKASLLFDLAARGDFGGFAGLDMTLGNGPATFRVLDQENLNVFFIFGKPENYTTRSRLAYDRLDGGFFTENSGLNLGESRLFSGGGCLWGFERPRWGRGGFFSGYRLFLSLGPSPCWF